jgi:tRNA pseudouridine38-40 synthase
MPTFKVTLTYDGSEFVGWQRQASGTSIQGLLEDALAELDGRPVIVSGAGRTDAGVHALGQVASFSLVRLIEPAILVRAINSRLPQTVRIVEASEMPSTFHARFGAVAKTYRYRLWIGEVMSPFERAYAWHIPYPKLDVAAMGSAARLLEGQHDFSAFQATGSITRSTTREVFSSSVAVSPSNLTEAESAGRTGRLVTYDVTADGFLRHMVRAIVGSLVEVGRGKRSPQWISELLVSRNRALAGRTAPPQGLFLASVLYAKPSTGDERRPSSLLADER